MLYPHTRPLRPINTLNNLKCSIAPRTALLQASPRFSKSTLAPLKIPYSLTLSLRILLTLSSELYSIYQSPVISPNPTGQTAGTTTYSQQQPVMAEKQEYYTTSAQPVDPMHQQHQQPQQQMPVQQAPVQGIQPQPSQYHTATPLGNLIEAAAPVDCPVCRQRALTRVEAVSGNTTQYVPTFVFFRRATADSCPPRKCLGSSPLRLSLSRLYTLCDQQPQRCQPQVRQLRRFARDMEEERPHCSSPTLLSVATLPRL